jgi:hypothetical protein
MKKVLLCLLTITFLPELLSADTQNKESNLKNIDKLYKQRIINKNEYLNIKKDIYGINKSKKNKPHLSFSSDKKNKYGLKKKDQKQLKKFFSKIKLNIQDYVFTSEELEELGHPKKLNYKDYPLTLQKELKKQKHSFHAQAEKAGKTLYQTFTKGPHYGQRHPGKMIKGMAMYEIFYAQKLYKAKDALKRYDNDWSKSKEKFFKLKDNTEIDSLIGMNKGRKNMRKALGMSLEMSSEDAIKRFWVLGEFLELGKPQKLEKHSSEIKKRKKLINAYKVEIAALKKTLENAEKSESKEILTKDE